MEGGYLWTLHFTFHTLISPNHQALLYWDKVGSIVPADYAYNPEKFDRHMRVLLREELVEMVLPMNYLSKIPKFRNGFLNYIDNDPTIQDVICGRRTSFRTVKIHLEKMNGINMDLEKRGLAWQAGYPWYNVEEHTANCFMTYLGLCLSNVLSYRLITDRVEGLTGFCDCGPIFTKNVT